MKKFLSAILSAVLILSLGTGAFAATSAQKKAFDLYLKAIDKLNSADSVVMDMDMDMVMNIDGQEIATNIYATITQVLEDGIPTQMHMAMEMPSIEGEGLGEIPDISTEMFYQDGYAFIETAGEKIKMAMPVDEFLAQASAISATPVEFPAEMIDNMTYSAQGNNRTVTFEMTAEELMAASEEYLTQFSASTEVEGLEGILSNIEYGDIVISVTMDNRGNFKSMNMVFEAATEIEGLAVSYAYNIAMDFVQIGGASIEFPADLDTYTDYTALLEEAVTEEEAVEEEAAPEEEVVDEEAAPEEEVVDEEAAPEEEAVDEEAAPEEETAE